MAEEKEQNNTSVQPESETTKKTSFKEEAKSYFNKAKLSRYLGLIAVIVATVVLSLYQMGWDPARIGWQSFIANTSLLVFLGVYGIFFGENEGKSLFKSLATGLYQATREAFLEIVDLITEKSYTDALPDYITWRYQKDYENTCKMKMLSVRAFDKTVLDLTDEEIEQLHVKPLKIMIEGKEHYYSKLSDKQYQVIKDIRDGNVFVDYIDDYNFFLVEADAEGKQLATQVKESESKKSKISWQQRLSRIIMIVLMAAIVAGFFIKYTESGGDPVAEAEAKWQAIRDLLSRISCLIVSIASGFNTARLLNQVDVFVLKYKTSYDKTFYCCMENKTFTPTDYQTKAEQEFNDYQEKERKAAEAVVTPEVINPGNLIGQDAHLLEEKHDDK